MFNARDWYWLHQDGRVFASARLEVVGVEDPGYTAFKEAGEIPTVWPRDEAGFQTDEALQEVLTPYGLILPTTSLAAVKDLAIRNLRARCSAEIVGGYQSTALGIAHLYPSGIVDQINMLGSVTASLLPDVAPEWSTPFWCQAPDGSWAMRAHNAGEVQQAGRDGKAHVVACQTILDTLISSIGAASTVEAIAAVTWP